MPGWKGKTESVTNAVFLGLLSECLSVASIPVQREQGEVPRTGVRGLSLLGSKCGLGGASSRILVLALF